MLGSSYSGKPPQEELRTLQSLGAEAREVRRPDDAWTIRQLSAQPVEALREPPKRQASTALRSQPLRRNRTEVQRCRATDPAGQSRCPRSRATSQTPWTAEANLRSRRYRPSEPGHHKGDLTRKSSAAARVAGGACPGDGGKPPLLVTQVLRGRQPQGLRTRRSFACGSVCRRASWPREQALAAGDTSRPSAVATRARLLGAPCRGLMPQQASRATKASLRYR